MPTVAELLKVNRTAHVRYRTAHLTSGNLDKVRQAAAVQEALAALVDAEKADPAHADPAWRPFGLVMNGIPVATLVEFYVKFLNGTPAQVTE